VLNEGPQEYLLIKIEMHGQNIYICNMYRSPNSNEDNNSKLLKLINYVNKECHGPKIFCGDFNYPHINWANGQGLVTSACRAAADFMDCLRKNYLIQFVDQLTCYRPSDRPSTLDLIIGSDDFIDNIQYLSPIGKSDHSVLYFSCNIKPTLSHGSNANKSNYSVGDYDQLRKYVHSRFNDTSVDYNDVDAYQYHIKSVIHEGVRMFIPK